MPTVVDLRTAVIHRHVFELRYAFGHLYWDRCGKIVNDLVSRNDDWDFSQMDVGTCRLANPEKNLQFSYGPEKLDLSQTQTAEVDTLLEIGQFASLADAFSASVAQVLQVTDFPRIGFRTWLLYPTATREDSHDRVKDLKVFTSGIGELLGALGRVSESSCRLVVDCPNHMVRVNVVPFEQVVVLPPGVTRAARMSTKAQPHHQRQLLLDKERARKIIKNYPQFGVLVDLDAYVEEPPYPEGLSITSFIEDASRTFVDIQQVVLEKRT